MAKKNGSELTTPNTITDIAPVTAPNYQQFVETVDESWLEGIKIERIVTLDAGQGVRGAYLGIGPTVEVSDPVTGEVRDLPTHRVAVRDNVVVRLLESSQLKRELAVIKPGTQVRIIKLGQVDTRKGRRVNDYIVAPVPSEDITSGTA
jgi:hypothetical protein